MPDEQFDLLRRILAAPSPVGFEAAMTRGVLEPHFGAFKPASWAVETYRGNAGIVLDTHPGRDDLFTVMIVGHADKIRMQVRSIADDGKIWIESDSFLPSTLIGHEVLLFSEDPAAPGRYRALEGGTIEAIGAIHFADAKLRDGDRGIRKNMLYLELQLHGEKKKEQVKNLGIKPGDPIILNRPIKRAFSPDTFYGAYLDNGVGCFVTAECARLVAELGGLQNVRVLYTIAAYEEIGRLGSRVQAQLHKPDVLIAVDVNHDFDAAPGVKDKHFSPMSMGKGFTLSVGSVVSEYLNSLIKQVALDHEIPYMESVSGRDTGTDAMAAVLASIDAAVTSIGFPIRNMHTISETAHTGDILAAVWVLVRLLQKMDAMNGGAGITSADFQNGHPRLDRVDPMPRPTPVASSTESADT
ncbi:MAG: M20/M25/M40 family metallo-hydrolase [Myxococcales bacterium]|nr:M20/M25/M40 family metallo-hydrolase [Myxococcales bacterium]